MDSQDPYETSIVIASCDAAIAPIRRLESIGTCYLLFGPAPEQGS
jgi:hypothetical protein